MLIYLILQMQEEVVPNYEQFFPTLVEYISISPNSEFLVIF